MAVQRDGLTDGKRHCVVFPFLCQLNAAANCHLRCESHRTKPIANDVNFDWEPFLPNSITFVRLLIPLFIVVFFALFCFIISIRFNFDFYLAAGAPSLPKQSTQNELLFSWMHLGIEIEKLIHFTPFHESKTKVWAVRIRFSICVYFGYFWMLFLFGDGRKWKVSNA